jgi:hypothetical protein
MFFIGLLMLVCGVFLLVYGSMLFRFALAVGGFVLGFSLASWLLAGQSDVVRVIVSLVTGGILAFVGYTLVQLAFYIAGGLLGAVLTLVLVSLLGIQASWLNIILVLAGAGVVGFFGRRLGDWVMLLGTSLAGAYAVIYGLSRMFAESVGVDPASQSATIPLSGIGFVIFLTVFAIGVLAQFQISNVRGRYVNR